MKNTADLATGLAETTQTQLTARTRNNLNIAQQVFNDGVVERVVYLDTVPDAFNARARPNRARPPSLRTELVPFETAVAK